MQASTRKIWCTHLLIYALALWVSAADTTNRTPAEIFSAALSGMASIIEPPAEAPPRTFSTTLKIVKAEGWPTSMTGQAIDLAYQGPDRFVFEARLKDRTYAVGRNQQELWIHVPAKKFAVRGLSGVPRFASSPDKKDDTELPAIGLPLPREQLALLALLMEVEGRPAEMIENQRCLVLLVSAKSEVMAAFKLGAFRLKLWLRESDLLPARISYTDGKKINVDVELQNPRFSEPWPARRWNLSAAQGDRVETAALSHLVRFTEVAFSLLEKKIPTLGPATGARRVAATEGKGRLEIIDETRVLFLKGTPEEMGTQHGKLLKRQVGRVLNSILYGVGVGSSFEKGRWFFGEIEQAQARLGPFMDSRYLREMDALAQAAGREREEVRLANYFPELFHCSGFAVSGKITAGGRLYHGRVLDYLRGVGLEQNAVVIVCQPDQGNAWVNVSYAGFIGSVTAMNEKGVAIGEMGGRGEGNWDGKPMAQLVREVMERAGTLDEAVAILRRGPRTCEYYYVVSDGKTRRAVGIAATPTTFEMVWPGESHPRLPHAIPDAVLMSAGDRYETLVQRVKSAQGKLVPDSARDLMTRPVCMKSNIHSVLFEPETLDFWVANADAKNEASHTRYTHYNLGELLKEMPAGSETSAGTGR